MEDIQAYLSKNFSVPKRHTRGFVNLFPAPRGGSEPLLQEAGAAGITYMPHQSSVTSL